MKNLPSRDIILGTAGHVDHGKTALIEALTGYNGDELAEEKERGITIDLSFSNMRRNGTNVAFIDVPGHERLIKNMISGAFGFDAALVVIDANEGIMPQTREHLAVLDVVGVQRIVIVLTKSDLAEDATIVHQRQAIETYMKENYPQTEIITIIPTSIHKPETIEALRNVLFGLSPRTEADAPFFRYYIDRVFSPRGIGTVVTGTVLSGTVSKGDKLTVAELGKPATVRNIQVHGEDQTRAHTHQRVALNLDIAHTRLSKGYLLVSRGFFRGFSTLDVSLKMLGDTPITHESDVLFISGAKRVEARVLLHSDPRFATLKLNEKVFTRFGDPFVLLLSGRPIAGGTILIPISEPIRKRQKLSLLQALDQHNFAEAFALLMANHRRGFGLISSYQRFGIGHEEALNIAHTLKESFVDEKDLVIYPLSAQQNVYDAIHAIYENNPRAFLSPTSVTLRIKWASTVLVTHVMKQMLDEGYLILNSGIYLRADQDADDLLNGLEERIYTILDEEGLTPEAPYNLYDRLDLDRASGDQAFKSLTKRKKVIRLTHNLFVTETTVRKALALMREIIVSQGYIDIRNFKTTTGMSRKYCIAYLEMLDQSGDVVKEGEKRVLRFG